MSVWRDFFIDRLASRASLGQLKPTAINSFMTSRPAPRIQTALRKTVCAPDHTVSDWSIGHSWLHRAPIGGRWTAQSDSKRLQQSLRSKSQGLFLYTKLMIDYLACSNGLDSSQPASFANALNGLPDGLLEMQTRMLQDQSVRSKSPQSFATHNGSVGYPLLSAPSLA